MKRKNINWGKTKCCKADVECAGGGYDGEDIVPVVAYCKKCRKRNPYIIQRVGKPNKLPF